MTLTKNLKERSRLRLRVSSLQPPDLLSLSFCLFKAEKTKKMNNGNSSDDNKEQPSQGNEQLEDMEGANGEGNSDGYDDVAAAAGSRQRDPMLWYSGLPLYERREAPPRMSAPAPQWVPQAPQPCAPQGVPCGVYQGQPVNYAQWPCIYNCATCGLPMAGNCTYPAEGQRFPSSQILSYILNQVYRAPQRIYNRVPFARRTSGRYSARPATAPPPQRRTRFCSYCAERNFPQSIVSSHNVRERTRWGTFIITCPYLRSVKCVVCGATGDNAHESYSCLNYMRGL